MSLVTDSPVHSSSSDDFAAFLYAELNSNSSASSPEEEDEDDESKDGEAEDDNELEGVKRCKVEMSGNIQEHVSTSHETLEHKTDVSRGDLFMLDFIHMMTKLRPFVRTFLKEPSEMFEMHIYTMGDRLYALEMARLLDPNNEYFNAKVIS